MTALRIHLLGLFEVLREGQPLNSRTRLDASNGFHAANYESDSTFSMADNTLLSSHSAAATVVAGLGSIRRW